jgi:hypothetical protein
MFWKARCRRSTIAASSTTERAQLPVQTPKKPPISTAVLLAARMTPMSVAEAGPVHSP